MAFKAHVKAGRLVLDEPTDLPEGTEVELVPLETPEEHAALLKALDEAADDIERGDLIDGEEVMSEVTALYGPENAAR